MQKTSGEWEFLFKKYESERILWRDYFFEWVTPSERESKTNANWKCNEAYKIRQAKARFIQKYRKWKIDHNSIMRKTKNKQRTKEEIAEVVSQLTQKELEDIAKYHLERLEKEKNKDAGAFDWSISRKAFVFNISRSGLYKKKKERVCKFDFLKDRVKEIMDESNLIYGSRRVAIILQKESIEISDRTLRNYMVRWGFKCPIRKARRKSESKDTKVRYEDLVKRNYNPVEDNIIATDVSYIPADVSQNHIYLSVAISHKTKLVVSWKLSKTNDTRLVADTFNNPKRTDFIMHSDHGSQYSTQEVRELAKGMKLKISMSRVGNSLDNRGVEYFFGILKSECLNRYPTHKYTYEQIYKLIEDYIEWYNTKEYKVDCNEKHRPRSVLMQSKVSTLFFPL